MPYSHAGSLIVVELVECCELLSRSHWLYQIILHPMNHPHEITTYCWLPCGNLTVCYGKWPIVQMIFIDFPSEKYLHLSGISQLAMLDDKPRYF